MQHRSGSITSGWCNRIVVGLMLTMMLLVGSASFVRAQQPDTAVPPPAPGTWQVNIAPYLWLPTARLDLSYHLPDSLGGRLPTEGSSGPGDYISHLDMATALTGEARNGPFSILTDVMYTRFSVAQSNIKSIDFFGLPSIPIDRSLETSTGTTLKTLIWTLAGGYTVAQGDWGNIDAIAGVRLLWMSVVTNYSLALTITGPRGNGATFGGIGGISGNFSIWNGIVGVRGKIRLAKSRFFIPYYVDVGGGGSQPTWQVATGLGYQANWGAVSATYRYLSFRQSGDNIGTRITLGGPMLMATFTF